MSDRSRPYYYDAKFHDMEHPWNYDMPNVRMISKVFTLTQPPKVGGKDPVFRYYREVIKEYKCIIDNFISSDMNELDHVYNNRPSVSPLNTIGNESSYWITRPIKNEIRRRREEYMGIIDRVMKVYENDWSEKGTITIDAVLVVGLMMGDLLCGNYDSHNSYYNMKWRGDSIPQELWDTIYPILDHTCHFPYNTFLYAFFNGVIIYGIPSKSSGIYCPLDFVDHDLGWTLEMGGGEKQINPFSIIGLRPYLQILYDNHLQMYGKIDSLIFELGLFALWYFIHESGYREDRSYLYERAMSRLQDVATINLVNDPKYDPILIRANNIRDPIRRSQYMEDTVDANFNTIVYLYDDYIIEEEVRLGEIYPVERDNPRLIADAFDYIDYVHDLDPHGVQITNYIDTERYIETVIIIMEEEYPTDIIPYNYPTYHRYIEILREYSNTTRDDVASAGLHSNRNMHYVTAAYLFAGMSILRWDLVQDYLSDLYDG